MAKKMKTAASIEAGDKVSFDRIDTTVEIATAPIGDRSFRLIFKTITAKDVEYMASYPEEINLGDTKKFRNEVKKDVFDELLSAANKFDSEFQKIMKKFELVKIKG